MAETIAEYDGNGVLTDFVVPFSYLDPAHVHVQVDGVTQTFTFQTPGLVRIAPAPGIGTRVRIFRQTPTANLLAQFAPTSSLTSADLNLALLQSLYVIQEAADAAGLTLSASSLGELYARNAAWFYDVVVSVPFTPDPNETFFRMPITRAVQLPGGALLSRAVANNPPGVSVSFEMLRNNVVFGTVSFAAAGGAGTFNVPAPVSFVDGDTFSMRIVGSAPILWRDFGFNFRMLKVITT